jgi:hypothetical protein
VDSGKDRGKDCNAAQQLYATGSLQRHGGARCRQLQAGAEMAAEKNAAALAQVQVTTRVTWSVTGVDTVSSCVMYE